MDWWLADHKSIANEIAFQPDVTLCWSHLVLKHQEWTLRQCSAQGFTSGLHIRWSHPSFIDLLYAIYACHQAAPTSKDSLSVSEANSF